jgi:D-threo-aldose 1-dehydrogenase
MLSRFMDHGRFDCFLLAGRYSLLDQTALPEFLPKCRHRGVGVIVGGVFNSGLLAHPVRGATFDYVQAPEHLVERALKLKAVCERHGVSLKAAAIQFPLAHPAVTSILTGVRTKAEWDENNAALRSPIPGDLWAELRAEGLMSHDAPVPQ